MIKQDQWDILCERKKKLLAENVTLHAVFTGDCSEILQEGLDQIKDSNAKLEEHCKKMELWKASN